MTTHRTTTAIQTWMSLDAEERHLFGRAIEALQSVGVDAPRATPAPGRLDDGQLAFAGMGAAAPTPASAPLPPGSGQRSSRLQVPAYDPAVFLSHSYRAIAGAGPTTHLYCASSSGTAALYRGTRTTVYKAGTTTGAIADRIAGLNAIGYAGWRRSGPMIVAEDGYTSWRAEPLPLTTPRPLGSPVRACPNGLAVALPAGLAVETFDIAVTTALLPISLATLLATPRFRLSLLSAGCDPEILERYTPKPNGGGHKRVAELVRIQPRRDADVLAAVAESIVAAHVTGQPALAA